MTSTVGISVTPVQKVFKRIAELVRSNPRDPATIPVHPVHGKTDTMGSIMLAIKSRGTVEYGLKDALSIETAPFSGEIAVEPPDIYQERISQARESLKHGRRECWYLMCRRTVEDYVRHGTPSLDEDAAITHLSATKANRLARINNLLAMIATGHYHIGLYDEPQRLWWGIYGPAEERLILFQYYKDGPETGEFWGTRNQTIVALCEDLFKQLWDALPEQDKIDTAIVQWLISLKDELPDLPDVSNRAYDASSIVEWPWIFRMK